MRRTGTRTLVPLALAFALAACSPPAGGPTLTAEETGDRLGALALRASNVIGDPAVGEFHQAVAGLAPAGLPAGTGGDLPRGVYRFDDESGAWVDVADSDDLDLNWTVEPGPRDARLLVDWDAAAPTVRRTLASGEEVELPTGATVTMWLDGAVTADLDQSATWPVNACGTLTEPGDLYMNGHVAHGAATLTVDRVGLSVNAGDDEATAGGSGGLELSVPAGRAWVDWDASVALDVTRDEATCEVLDAVVRSGRLRVEAGIDTAGGDGSAAVATDFAPVTDGAGELTGVELANGSLVLDGAVAVTWDGVLDDADEDGVPGENLVLTFADRTMTLEEFIRERFGPLAFGASVVAALR